MTDNKYTAMLRENESWWEHRAGYYASSGSKTLADKCEAKASDWRALREALEGLIKALEDSQNTLKLLTGCQQNEYGMVDGQIEDNKAALAAFRDAPTEAT